MAMEKLIPYDELNRRISKLQTEMQKHQISGSLLMQRADLYYFSGTGQNAFLFVPATGIPTLIVKKSLERAREESALEQIEPYSGTEQLKKLIVDNVMPGASIGLEADVLPANLYLRYQKTFKEFPLVDISGAIRRIRSVKSDFELALMHQAAAVGNEVLNYACKIIKPGMREIELAGQLEMEARRLGHQGAIRMRGFNQEIYFGHIMSGQNAASVSFFDGPTGGSGLNPSYPQGAGTSLIREKEPILVDFVIVIGGYMVDQTRIFSIGEPAAKLQEAYYQAVLINRALAQMGKPGTGGSALYKKAQGLAEQAGLARHFMGYTEQISFVGHGVGIELDELPVIARDLDFILEKGMVFALEPKFIFPGEGTVGIEDTYVVGDDRLEQVTTFSDRLQVL